jgi:hypothetical protein
MKNTVLLAIDVGTEVACVNECHETVCGSSFKVTVFEGP